MIFFIYDWLKVRARWSHPKARNQIETYIAAETSETHFLQWVIFPLSTLNTYLAHSRIQIRKFHFQHSESELLCYGHCLKKQEQCTTNNWKICFNKTNSYSSRSIWYVRFSYFKKPSPKNPEIIFYSKYLNDYY